MDIYCPKCGEPWEIDSLHEEVSKRNPGSPWLLGSKPEGEYSYSVGEGIAERWHSQKEYEKYFNIVRSEFSFKGCEALTIYGGHHNETTLNPRKNGIYGALMEFAGDDIDFAASMMEDAERWGLFGDEFDD